MDSVLYGEPKKEEEEVPTSFRIQRQWMALTGTFDIAQSRP